jgi:hypothetical protein
MSIFSWFLVAFSLGLGTLLKKRPTVHAVRHDVFTGGITSPMMWFHLRDQVVKNKPVKAARQS